MSCFVSGVLEQNEDGATYEGIVYDRFLMLRHANGKQLLIFDMTEPISADLAVGRRYTVVVVAAIPGSVQHLSRESPTLRQANGWQGVVVDPQWSASSETYRQVRPELYQQDWLLLSTPIGEMLMSPGEIAAQANQGDIIVWENARFDLYAIV
jgi:hypothetical protein